MLAQLIAPLLALPDVDPALAAARTSVDTALRHKALRRSGGPLAAEVGLRSAVASAALGVTCSTWPTFGRVRSPIP